MRATFLFKPSSRFLTLGISAFLALGMAACSSDDGGGGPNAPATPAVLLDPSAFAETAPATFVARFNTSEGVFRVEVTRADAPLGADRFFNLVRNGYYDQVRFFRIVQNFVAQFGIHGDPAVNTVWRQQRINDDPVVKSNVRGTLTFATGGANTRTVQVFINLVDNGAGTANNLDARGFAPFGRVIEGMAVVDALFSGYGESPEQQRIQNEGNAYLNASFPNLDFVLTAVIE